MRAAVGALDYIVWLYLAVGLATTSVLIGALPGNLELKEAFGPGRPLAACIDRRLINSLRHLLVKCF